MWTRTEQRDSMVQKLLMSLLLGILSRFAHAQDVSNFSKLSCDALLSCSPSSCVTSSDVDCSINTNTADFVSTISNLSCNSGCTQSSNSKCSTTYLKQVLKADAGIKAAYCNDNFLVIWSTSNPRYEPDTNTFIHSKYCTLNIYD